MAAAETGASVSAAEASTQVPFLLPLPAIRNRPSSLGPLRSRRITRLHHMPVTKLPLLLCSNKMMYYYVYD